MHPPCSSAKIFQWKPALIRKKKFFGSAKLFGSVNL